MSSAAAADGSGPIGSPSNFVASSASSSKAHDHADDVHVHPYRQTASSQSKRPTPSAYRSVVNSIPFRGRLPSTIDASLAPLCGATRQSFAAALTSDQLAALEPDVTNSFRSANDVVKRLLPYHVWHVRDADVLHVLHGSMSDHGNSSKETKGTRSIKGSPSLASPAALGKNGAKRPIPSADAIESYFPSDSEAQTLWDRYIDIDSRSKRLRRRMTGACVSHGSAPFVQESCYNLENLAWEHERELFIKEQDELRTAKEQAIAHGVKWETIMRITTGRGGSIESEESDEESQHRPPHRQSNTPDSAMDPVEDGRALSAFHTSPQQHPDVPPSPGMMMRDTVTGFVPAARSPASLVGGPASDGAHADDSSTAHVQAVRRPRGRPRKQRDEHGRIIRTPPGSKSSNVATPTPRQTPSSPSSVARPSPQPMQPMPPTAASIMSSPFSTVTQPPHSGAYVQASSGFLSSSRPPTASSPSSSADIPSHPIRIILPQTAMPRLSELGITVIPAPHLMRAVSAQQTSQTDAAAVIDAILRSPDAGTAPQPAPNNQQEAALLLGITTAPSGTANPTPNAIQPRNLLQISVILSKLGPSQLAGLASLMQSVQGPVNSPVTGTPPAG